METSYLYKVSRAGVFLGLVPNVTSPFKYTNIINSAGASLSMVVAVDPYEAQEAVDEIITESGDNITTEDGDYLTTERPYPIFGNDWSGALIRNGNTVEVVEISEDNPEGVTVFEGYISQWGANFGGPGGLRCTVLSFGAQLDNYIISAGQTTDQSQLLQNTSVDIRWHDALGLDQRVIQSFVVGASITELSGMDFTLAASSATWNGFTWILELFTSLAGAESGSSPIATAEVVVIDTTARVYSFVFGSPAAVVGGQTYYARIRSPQSYGSNGVLVYYSNASPYADGALRDNTSGSWANTGGDAYFVTFVNSSAIAAPFSDQDPADILTSIIDDFVSAGGVVNYDTGTIETTGLTRTYTFRLATVLEGVRKCLELSPSDWYWYVDPATSIIYFKETDTTADHVMVLGQHIAELDLTDTIEYLKNVAYFTGGDTGAGENLFIYDQDSDSLAEFPQGLVRLSDNRVTLTDTGQALIDNVLNSSAGEQYITQITIPKSVYDISSFSPGQIVGFGGFQNLVDRLLLQIVSLARESEQVTLGLGMLPIRASKAVEDAQRQLLEIQTVNNPDEPS